MKINCPKCNAKYVKSAGDKSYHCSDATCELFWHEHKENPWPNIWRIIRYSTPKDLYYGTKILLFRRYDLIRTGVGKNHWCDKDRLMLHGMMGLLQDYIEKECSGCEWFSLSGWDDYKDDNEVPIPTVILNLYIDWKINYPKAQKAEEVALNEWADATTKMITKVNKELSLSSLTFEAAKGYTNEERKVLFDKHGECEKAINDMEQDMLHRLVDVRSFLWV